MAGERPEIVIEYNAFPILSGEIAGKADEICMRTALDVMIEAVHLIQSPPKSGRTYARSAIKRRLTKKDVVFDVTMFGKTRQYTQHGLRVTESKSGKLSKIVGYTLHRASAPGEAPATDTGFLAASGYTKAQGMADWEVGFHAEYAAALEYGTPTIQPRPFLRPAAEKYTDAFLEAMADAMAGANDLPDAAGGGGGGGAM